MIDELQHLRMFYVWPFVVGATAFFATRLFLYYANGIMERRDVALSALVGGLAAVVAHNISASWSDDGAHWLAFTVGLAFLAVVLVGTGMIVAISDVDDADRRRGRW